MCVECNYCRQVASYGFVFFCLRDILYTFCLRPAQVPILWMLLKCKSKLKYKSSRVQVHSQSDGPTRGHGVYLTRRSRHFRSSENENNGPCFTRATKHKVSLQQRGANGIQFSLKVEVLPLDKLETGQGCRYQVSKLALF